MNELTDQQRQVFDFVRDQLIAGRSAPTVREITAHFDWRSKRAAACHVEAIVRKGWLTPADGKARSLGLVRSVGTARPAVMAIPMLGSIPAGFSEHRDAESDECVPVTVESIGFQPTRNTFALRVTGDSMIGRHICAGDIAIFEHGAEPRPGQIVAALIDRKNTLKTYVVKNGRPYLKSENPKYPNLIPSEELVIQGVFRALIRRA